jgi:hypoxanthine phosphoribosyltransferase
MLPDYLEPVFSEDQINESVARLGAQITPWSIEVSQKTNKDLVVISILRGGLVFTADLIRKIENSIELTTITASSYSSLKNSTPHVDIKINFNNIDVLERSVLLVDDICDSGRTLAVLAEKLKLMGAREIKTAVLIHRKVDNHLFLPDYIAFPFEGESWLVGYGLEDKGKYRNLRSVYRVKEQ